MASNPKFENIFKVRNLTSAKMPSNEPDLPLSPHGNPIGEMEEVHFAPDPLSVQSMFAKFHESSPSDEGTTQDYFDINPSRSEAGSRPPSRPETPFDLNKEDPREGLLFLKPSPTYKRKKSVAETFRRKTRAMSAAYIEYVNAFKKKRYDPENVPIPEPKYQTVTREGGAWYTKWSTRRVILLFASTVALIFLAAVLTYVLIMRGKANHKAAMAKWRPAVGTSWQIQLNEPVSNPSYKAYVYDVDYFDNNKTTIELLHSMGRRVICHFSAGTYETWQSTDTATYQHSVLGNSVMGWGIERWIDIRQNSVKKIMADRILTAQQNGCDGIIPDNINGYLTDTGFNITVTESTAYVRYLAGLAHASKLSVGLINAPELINSTLDVIDFGMNEGCAASGTCSRYQPLIQAGKPVFHVEYATGTNSESLDKACNAAGTYAFSTLIKKAVLDEWSLECPVNSS